MQQRVVTIDESAAESRGPGRSRLRRRGGIPAPEELRNRELVEVVGLFGRPIATARLGLGHVVAFWKIGRDRLEIVFDEHHRAERISIT